MFVSPMLLQKSDRPFDDDEYITELKLDGIRQILSKFDNKVRLYTRHHNEVTSKFPELLSVDIPNGTVLDGEIVVTDSAGKPDFEAMMERFQSKRSAHSIQYVVFDVIYYNGDKVTNKPLIERKEFLESFLTPTPHIALVQWMYSNGEAYFELTKQHGLEGIVLKKADSTYKIGKRTHDWLKVINYQYADVFITGMRKDEFGLLLGVEDSGKIKHAGLMEFMNTEDRKTFYRSYKDLVTEENKNFVFLEPELKCRVKFRNYTKEGKLRIPSFVEYIS